MNSLITVVIPVFKNVETLRELYWQLKEEMDRLARPHELLFVDPALSGDSLRLIQTLAKTDPTVKAIDLPAHFGLHRAAIEGLKQACGDIVVVMNGGQEASASAISRLVALFDLGYDAVFADRQNHKKSLGRIAASKFLEYCLSQICSLPRGAGMFVAMKKSQVEAVLAIPMEIPHLAAMIGLAGLKTCCIPVDPQNQEIADEASSLDRLKHAFAILFHAIKAKNRLLQVRKNPAD